MAERMQTLDQAELIRRINEIVQDEDQVLEASDPSQNQIKLGAFYLRNTVKNIVERTHIDPEELARQLGLIEDE